MTSSSISIPLFQGVHGILLRNSKEGYFPFAYSLPQSVHPQV